MVAGMAASGSARPTGETEKTFHERVNAFGAGCAGLALLFGHVEAPVFGVPLALWSAAAIAGALLVARKPSPERSRRCRVGYLAAYGIGDALTELDEISKRGRFF